MGGPSLSEMERERRELQEDYRAFVTAYDIIRGRIRDSGDLVPPRVPQLHQWSGASAVCGSLEMAIHAIGRTIEEYNTLIAERRPKLSLVKESE